MKTEDFLAKNKFRSYGYQTTFNHVLWQKKFEDLKYVCQTNDNLYINIKSYDPGGVEIEIVAEDKNRVWFNLSAYSLLWNELPEKYEDIERKLLKAWEAINEI